MPFLFSRESPLTFNCTSKIRTSIWVLFLLWVYYYCILWYWKGWNHAPRKNEVNFLITSVNGRQRALTPCFSRPMFDVLWRQKTHDSNLSTDQVGLVVTCICETLGSTLERDSGHPGCAFLWFSSVLQCKFWDGTSIRSLPVPSKSFTVHV
jgi:hypothetical protein